jgi:hypothetical protein
VPLTAGLRPAPLPLLLPAVELPGGEAEAEDVPAGAVDLHHRPGVAVLLGSVLGERLVQDEQPERVPDLHPGAVDNKVHPEGGPAADAVFHQRAVRQLSQEYSLQH